MKNIFSREELLIGKENVEKLKKSKVAVFGIGGVGSYVVEALARAGIGNFVLVDNDNIDITNINRQIIATTKTIGKAKVEVAKERILEINPDAKVNTYKEFYMPDNKIELTSNISYIVDAIDTVTAKIEDIYKTSVCPLAKVMRKELRNRGIKKLKVVYSKEEPIRLEINSNNKVPGSISFVPSIAGLIIASEVIKDILKSNI